MHLLMTHIFGILSSPSTAQMTLSHAYKKEHNSGRLLLHATGGKLNFIKCHWYLIKWKWNEDSKDDDFLTKTHSNKQQKQATNLSLDELPDCIEDYGWRQNTFHKLYFTKMLH